MGEPPEEAEQVASQLIMAAANEADSVLSLSGLGLARLPDELRMLRYLTRLDLSDNLLTELPEWIGELSTLELLVLRGNRLMQLPPSLARLGRLTQLDAADNRLLQVAPELATMPRLAAIELRGNPHLLVPPPEIVARGNHAVLDYLRGHGVPGESANEVTIASSPVPPIPPIQAGDEHGVRRKALLIGVPVLVIGAVVAITAAMSGGQPAQTSDSSLPTTQAATSIGAVVVSSKQATSTATKTPHAPTYSPTPTSEHASTHAATPGASTTPTTGATTSEASAASTTTAADAVIPTASPGVDLALDRPATATTAMQYYPASNVVDGSPSTYWESVDGDAFPQTLTVDLGEVTTVGSFEFRLPDASGWNERTETFTILGSTDGTDFFTIAPSAVYTFNANSSSDDTASLTISPVHTRYVELYFTATDGWPAAQIGELDVYS
jgi:hypothetical protein